MKTLTPTFSASSFVPHRWQAACLAVATAALVSFSASRAAEWNLNNTGNWNVNGNWVNPATFPNGVDAVADFSKLDITGHRTINVEQAITIGSLLFGDTNGSHDYILQPGAAGSLTFDVSAGNASVTRSSGRNDQIYAPITLNDQLVVTNNGPNSLYFRGGINTNGNDMIFEGTGLTRFQDAASVISGSGGIVKNGSGALMLGGPGTSANHSYTGTLTINGGRVMTFPDNNLGPGNVTINDGYLDWYWSGTFTRSLGVGQNQLQILGGTSGFSQNGSTGLTIRLNNNANYEVVWGSDHFQPDVLVLQAPNAQNNSNLNFQNRLDLNGATRTIQTSKTTGNGLGTALISNIIRDSQNAGAGLIKTGDGILRLNAANTFTGGVEIAAGTIRLENNSGLGSGGPLNFSGSGSQLDLRASPTVGALSGTGNFGLVTAGVAGARTLTVNQATDTTFGGVIQNGLGTVALTKSGAGALTLSGANTYTGATLVSGGTLIVNGSLANASAVTVESGATLGGNGAVGAVTLTGARIAPGASIGTLNTGTENWGAGSIFEFEFSTDGSTGSAGSEWDLLAINGDLNITAPTTIELVTMANSTTSGLLGTWNPNVDATWAGFVTTTGTINGFDPGSFSFDTSGFQNNPLDGVFSVALGAPPAGTQGSSLDLIYTANFVIPEPSRAILFALGLLALLGRRRR